MALYVTAYWTFLVFMALNARAKVISDEGSKTKTVGTVNASGEINNMAASKISSVPENSNSRGSLRSPDVSGPEVKHDIRKRYIMRKRGFVDPLDVGLKDGYYPQFSDGFEDISNPMSYSDLDINNMGYDFPYGYEPEPEVNKRQMGRWNHIHRMLQKLRESDAHAKRSETPQELNPINFSLNKRQNGRWKYINMMLNKARQNSPYS